MPAHIGDSQEAATIKIMLSKSSTQREERSSSFWLILFGLRLCLFDLPLIRCIDLLRARRWEDRQVGGTHSRICMSRSEDDLQKSALSSLRESQSPNSS